MKNLKNTTDKQKERLLYLFEQSALLKEAYKSKNLIKILKRISFTLET